MLELRKANDRGHANHGWLDSFHSFSFAGYHDPGHMGFGPLRVINEDWIDGGQGFGTHGHQNMEIITYMLEGALEHKDSMGNGSVIRPGDVQRMSAGTGVRHSEFNHSAAERAHLLQIWIMPDVDGIAPGYEEKRFSAAEKTGRLRLIASADARDGSVKIHQDASVYAGLFDGDQHASVELAAGRLAYIHVARGSLKVNGQSLQTGDALKVAGVTTLSFTDGDQAEVLLFDLPK
ncbi:pirin family protein [Herbaspirillum autotrophicum]|uniref:pirin family protein n=1 Tax=Herbaspirillum autotrophicum TaxID=180195 RepID=UPI00067C7311|nr:pirin family protein [Herbaspirillum autotrophicum]